MKPIPNNHSITPQHDDAAFLITAGPAACCELVAGPGGQQVPTRRHKTCRDAGVPLTGALLRHRVSLAVD